MKKTWFASQVGSNEARFSSGRPKIVSSGIVWVISFWAEPYMEAHNSSAVTKRGGGYDSLSLRREYPAH